MSPDGAADRNFSKGGSLTNNGKIEYKKNSRAEAGAGTDRMEQTAHRRFAPLEN